jgi:hypothetical protein
VAGVADQLGVLVQRALGVLERLGLKLLTALLEDALIDQEVEEALLSVDDDGVAITDEADGAALLGLGDDVADQESVGATGEAAVGDQGNVLAETRAHDGGGGLQHLDHSRSTLGTLVADHHHRLLALLDLAALERLDEGVFAVEGARLTLEAQALLARDLTDGSAGSQGAAQDLDVAGRLDGVAERADDLLRGREALDLLEVLGERLAGNGHDGAVDEVVLEQVLEQRGSATDALDVGHDVLARGLEVGQEGRAVRGRLEVVDGERDANAVRNRDQVQYSVGGASSDVDHHHGVLERRTRHNVAGLDVLLQKVPDGGAGLQTLVALGLGLGRVGGRAGQSHSHRLDGGGHGVGRVHTTTGAGAGAGVADDVESLGFIDVLGDVLSVRLESW